MATTKDKLQDPNLSEKEQDEIIGAFIQLREDARLRDRWEKKLHQDYKLSKQSPTVTKPGAKIRKIGIILAAVAASLLLLFAIVPQFLQPSGQELLAAYVEDVNLDGVRELGDSSIEELRRQLSDAFAKQEFTAAVRFAEGVVALPEATDEDRLNLGEAYLRNQQFSLADATFNDLISGNSVYLAEARFNLALSLLSQQKTTKGLAELRKITTKDGNKMYRQAQELLDAKWK